MTWRAHLNCPSFHTQVTTALSLGTPVSKAESLEELFIQACRDLGLLFTPYHYNPN